MNDLYNIFGEFVSNKSIEKFTEVDEETQELVDVSDKIADISAKMKTGEIREDEIKKEILNLKKLASEGKLSKADKISFKKLIKNNVRLTDGINLVGNLELGGIIKARGFHLADGTKINSVVQHKEKLAVPLDKDGNIHIKPKAGKTMKINKTDVKELNIPKSGRITFGAGEDSDPYNLKKVGNKDANHLRLTLNDNANESLQIWGNSCKTDKCDPDGGKVYHVFDSDGNAVHYGNLTIQNPKNKNNPSGHRTHFNYKKDGRNYIRGKTELKGDTKVYGKLCVYEPGKKTPTCLDSNLLGSSKTMNVQGNANVKGDIVFNGGNNWIMHTPDDKRHTLYIAPSKTKGKGDWNWAKQTRFLSNGEVILNNGKHGTYNRTGWPTHFNNRGLGLNYIRGQTELRGEVNFVDNAKGVNITNAKNGNNPSGGGTHFNYKGKGLNYLRGKTEIRGETNFVDKGKGINIHNSKNGNNPIGWGTHFNYQGKGLNYIRGKTEIRAPQVNVISNSGIRVHGHGKVSTFGSLNSGWCHLTTNAPQFYMNKSLQVNGAISSYSNKPLNANRGVNAPHYSRIGGDWLRINPEGNSVGRVAAYGGFSINDVRRGKGGLGVGYWGYPGRGNIRATGNIQANNGMRVTGGRTWIQDAEKKGRLRVGAAWGIPGLYSEDNQDIVVGCNGNRQVHLGRPNLVRIDKHGNIHLPRGRNIYIGGKKVVKNGDQITLRSQRNGTRLQHSNWHQTARFINRNRGQWERLIVETF